MNLPPLVFTCCRTLFALGERLFAERLECVQQFANTSSAFQNETSQCTQRIGDLESCFSAEQTPVHAHGIYSSEGPGEQEGCCTREDET